MEPARIAGSQRFFAIHTVQRDGSADRGLMLRHFSRGRSGDDFVRSENICQAHDVPPDDIGRSGPVSATHG